MSTDTISKLSRTNFADTEFITGLRAYAALLVILIHAGGGGLRAFGDVGNRIADLGATGVYMFFVISGFCISHSLTQKQNIKHFWWKRFWRVAPLYYTACAVALLFLLIFNISISPWREILGTENIFYDIFMHLTFLSFADYRVTNSLIGVEWSIPIEMFWYMVIPFALPFLKTWPKAVALLLLTCGAFALKEFYGHFIASDVVGYAEQWSPLRYAPAFFLGMVAFRVRPWFLEKFSPKLLDIGLAVLIISALIELIFLQLGNDFLNILLLTTGIITIGGTGLVSSILFESKVVIYLGVISYSLYMTHMFILFFLPENLDNMLFVKFIIVALASVLVSTLSYILIEQKGIKLGKKLYNGFDQKPKKESAC